ncbi:MAG: AsmA family protein [bacterium]|nr:AsmA family protein [bacterium]
MRFAVKLSVWVVTLVALTSGFALVFLVVASDDFYRRAARQIIERLIDREVRLDGTFSLALGLAPRLVVTDLWLENTPWAAAKEMAHLDRLEVQAALQPLLSGVVVIRRLVVEGLTLNLETARDGAVN